MLPTSAVPAIVGAASLVVPLGATVPVVSATSSVTLVMAGAAGAAVSTVMANGALGALVLPAGSVAVTLRVWGPSAKGVLGVKPQLPEPLAVTVPSKVAPS